MSTMISLICPQCNNNFKRQIRSVNRNKKHNLTNFCSFKCSNDMRTVLSNTHITCTECDSTFIKQKSQIKRSENHFCSRSCSTRYNNKHKTHGTRRSKLEIYIESKIKSEFPDLEFKANDKSIISSELDFYFPALNLAIEINGPLHYKPIYGKDKLIQIQNNDALKVATCSNADIKLAIINNLKNCTVSYANERWNKIKSLIAHLMVRRAEFESA